MSPALPTWAAWLQALAVPAIAFGGLMIGFANLWLAMRKRADELFDRRFGLLLRVRDFQRNRDSSRQPPDDSPIWEEAWAKFERSLASKEEILAEASLLFDQSFGDKLREFLDRPSQEAAYPEVDGRLLELFQSRMR